MDRFLEQEEWFSSQLKRQAGFGKGGEKNFDGVITELQMQGYIVIRDFRRRRRKKDGVEYGWPIAVYTTPENLWDYEAVSAAYKEDPQISYSRIVEQVKKEFPEASDRQLRML